MRRSHLNRRQLIAGAAAVGSAAFVTRPAYAKGNVTAAIYPGSWDEQYRAVVAPALKKLHDVDLALEPLFAVDQIAKAAAARGLSPFDCFVLDPGPRVTAIERGLFEPFDAAKLSNAANIAGIGIESNAAIVLHHCVADMECGCPW